MRGSFSFELLLYLLALVISILVLYRSFDFVFDRAINSLRLQTLNSQAASASLLASIYSYSVANGRYDVTLNCSIASHVYCMDDFGNVGIAKTYSRKGGGN